MTKPLGTLQHYLYSTPHLAGCAGAIGALALFFTGLIGPGWVVIVMGAYAAGALIGKSLAGEPTVVAHLDEEDVMRELVALENRARDLLPAQARQTLSAIVEKAAALLPELERLQAKGALSAAVRQDVIAGLTRYRLTPSTATWHFPRFTSRRTRAAAPTPQTCWWSSSSWSTTTSATA